jgi:hypothetical protein
MNTEARKLSRSLASVEQIELAVELGACNTYMVADEFSYTGVSHKRDHTWASLAAMTSCEINKLINKLK